ncbi:allantoicase repeat-containing protein [Pseudomonas sp. SJZ101]|nr:allantoicase repeat-containing protein [Pseudomonas sp. SJZ075]TWC26710.1 allantoicase repeat-containing protein [Pseudomonas sp. SJZ078]TWC45833.1 allantoicase repeat-containing protein [Pseudomonas sp. SJZ124]TWC81152.1 allantoicase repeat-containing protein [Pseudomonas sp. SJZ101]
MSNILNSGREINMDEGSVIVALGHADKIEKIYIDTLHFKSNYSDTCSIQGAFAKGGTDSQIETRSLFWRELLPSQKREMHEEHTFSEQIKGKRLTKSTTATFTLQHSQGSH